MHLSLDSKKIGASFFYSHKRKSNMEISKGNYILNQVFLNFNTYMYKKQVSTKVPVFFNFVKSDVLSTKTLIKFYIILF